jgi:hypothetical protein
MMDDLFAKGCRGGKSTALRATTNGFSKVTIFNLSSSGGCVPDDE